MSSLAEQRYADLEIIIIDASSTDRTIEMIRSYRLDDVHIYSVAKYFCYEMINRGISLATGEYINILFPGDFFISHDSLSYMAITAIDNDMPDLVYCGSMLHDDSEDTKIMLRPFTLDVLKGGEQPTSIKSCWFRADTLKRIGKFDTRYYLRGGFDIMCRFYLDATIKIARIKRVFTDYEGYSTTGSSITRHFYETRKIIRRHFGRWRAISWMMKQNIIMRFIKLLIGKSKTAFFRG